MSIKLANFATTVLGAPLADDDLELTVAVGTGSKFPALSAGQWFRVVLVDAELNYECLKVTARDGDVFTIVRAQEGTTARAWSDPDRVDLRITALALEELSDLAPKIAAATDGAFADADQLVARKNSDGTLLRRSWSDVKTAIRVALGAMVSASGAKATPVDADQLLLADSASSNATVKLSWLNLKATLFAALGALINGGTAKATPVDADKIVLADSAESWATKSASLANLVAYILGKAASAANYLSNTNGLVGVNNMWSAVAFKDLGNITGNTTVNLGTSTNAYATATGNFTFNGFTGAKPGQTGTWLVTASGGDRTVAFNATVAYTPNGLSLGTIASGTTVEFAFKVMHSGKTRISRIGTAS